MHKKIAMSNMAILTSHQYFALSIKILFFRSTRFQQCQYIVVYKSINHSKYENYKEHSGS